MLKYNSCVHLCHILSAVLIIYLAFVSRSQFDLMAVLLNKNKNSLREWKFCGNFSIP